MNDSYIPVIQSQTSDQTAGTTHDFLVKHPAGVLSTVDSEGNPHGTVIYFSITPEFQITFVTKEQTRKHQNIQAHKRVSLVVFDRQAQTSVQIVADAFDISDTEHAKPAFHAMLQNSQKDNGQDAPPVSKIFAGDYVTYALHPLTINISVYAHAELSEQDVHDVLEFMR